MKSALGRLLCEEDGSSAIEYAIMASVMGLMLVPIVAYLSSSIQISYDRLLGWF
jgi:Flp pilus assembly pilin Flp